MYAVIFRAEINQLDGNYFKTATQMKELAINSYGCTGFSSATEGSQEIAISYWQDLDQIKQWKHDAKHLVAQNLGSSKWYKSYHVQIVEIIREYNSNR